MGVGASCDLLAGTTTEEFNMVFALLGGDIDDAAADRALTGDGAVCRGRGSYRESLPDNTAGTSWARR